MTDHLSQIKQALETYDLLESKVVGGMEPRSAHIDRLMVISNAGMALMLKCTPTAIRSLIERLEAAERDAQAKQAKIDALMLEYCPDEMTPEQVEEWGRHQVPVDKDSK